MTYISDDHAGSAPRRGSAPLRGRASPLHPDNLDWSLCDPKKARRAHLARLILGALPRRAAKYACAAFDPHETREYGGEGAQSVAGRDLAGLTALIVKHISRPTVYIECLAALPAALIAPIKTYLRVKLALGRLEAEITAAGALAPPQTAAAYPPPKHVNPNANSGSSAAAARKAFTWDISPAKAYGFKEMTLDYGYDPRETSAYWIEKRANALRRKWTSYRKTQSGAARPRRRPQAGPTQRASVRVFEPADADYDSVWPPIKLPDGPPIQTTTSPLSSRTRCGTSHVQDSDEGTGTDNYAAPILSPERTHPDASNAQPWSRIFSVENSGMTGGREGDEGACDLENVAGNAPIPTIPRLSSRTRCGTSHVQGGDEGYGIDNCAAPILSPKSTHPDAPHAPPRSQISSGDNSAMPVGGGDEDHDEIHRNTAPMSAEFEATYTAAVAARERAAVLGRGLGPPPGYAQMFGGAGAGKVSTKRGRNHEDGD